MGILPPLPPFYEIHNIKEAYTNKLRLLLVKNNLEYPLNAQYVLL